MYLVSSGVMDMFDKIDAIDTLSFSSQKADGWYIESAKKAMEEGSLSMQASTASRITCSLCRELLAGD